MGILPSLVLGSMLATGVAAAQEAPAPDIWTDDRIQAAFHEVLAHGDLSDIGFLQKTLGLELKIMEWELPYVNDTVETRAEATTNPSYLIPYGTSYQLVKNTREGTTQILAHFNIRSCPSITAWGSAWDLQVQDTSGLADDMETYVSNQSLKWQPDPEAIVLQLTGIGGGCSIELKQHEHVARSLSKPPTLTPDPGTELLEQVIDLVVAGDLRDYLRTGRILRVEMSTSGELRGHRLYKGAADAEQIIPNTIGFSYDVDDTGWFIAGHPIFQRKRVPKWASLNIDVDTTTTCISPEHLAKRMRQRVLSFSKGEDNRGPTLQVSQRGEVFTVGYDVQAGCISEIRLRQ
jgi:hypothetical protein